MLSVRTARRWGPAILPALLLLALRPATAAPANDNIDDAGVISALPFSDATSNVGATTENKEPQPSCAAAMFATIWYRFTPTADTNLKADTFESDLDTVLAAYSVNPHGGKMTEVACSDDTERTFNDFGYVYTYQVPQSQVFFPVSAGVDYYFQIGTFNGKMGPITFNLIEEPPKVIGTRTETKSYTLGLDFVVLGCNIGGVCFDLTGNEVDVRLAIEDDVNGSETGAVYEVRDEFDTTLASGVFCGETGPRPIPSGGVRLTVWVAQATGTLDCFAPPGNGTTGTVTATFTTAT